MKKFMIALTLAVLVSVPTEGSASVSEATESGVEVHQSILRKVFVGTQKLLDKVHQKEKKEMEKQYQKGVTLGIRG